MQLSIGGRSRSIFYSQAAIMWPSLPAARNRRTRVSTTVCFLVVQFNASQKQFLEFDFVPTAAGRASKKQSSN